MRPTCMSTVLRNTVVGIASLASLGASFAVGTTYGDGTDPRSGAPIAASNRPFSLRTVSAAMTGSLDSGKSCAELLEWYRDEGVKLVGPYGWGSSIYAAQDMATGVRDAGPADFNGLNVAPRAAGTLTGATSSATGTNVQEAGVDEPDVVKTDGSTLVRVQDDRLTTYDVSSGEPRRLISVRLEDITDASLLLAGDRVIALGADDASANTTGRTRMILVDLSDPTAPEILETRVFSSALVSASQHGDTIRLVLSQGLPELDFTQPRRWRSEKSALERNQEVVRESTLEDWLPMVSGSETDEEALVNCGDVAIPDDDSGLGTLAVVGFDADESSTWSVSAVATDSRTAYTSAERLYLATEAGGWWGGWGVDCCWEGNRPMVSEPDGVTRLHQFELDGIAAQYQASGEVEGRVADRWSMDEADGVLRVAVGPTNATGNFNSVVLLKAEGEGLVEVGRVDKLGVNETIQSMRWFDTLAVMVTFRQIDPLYAIDLSDPEVPRLLGKLKIPGFSDYLHPIGPERIIGMGVNASLNGRTRGAQAGLFNLADVTNPRRVSTVEYGPRTEALAGADPRQFTWLPDQRTALTVIARGYGSRTGLVAVLKLVEGEFVSRLVEVEYGDEVSQVRLVPLASGPAAGSVILVTGDDVRSFTF